MKTILCLDQKGANRVALGSAVQASQAGLYNLENYKIHILTDAGHPHVLIKIFLFSLKLSQILCCNSEHSLFICLLLLDAANSNRFLQNNSLSE